MGEGNGSPRRQEGGGASGSIENPRRGISQERFHAYFGGGGGVEGPGGCLRGILTGGGGIYFFWGRNSHQVSDERDSADVSDISILFFVFGGTGKA